MLKKDAQPEKWKTDVAREERKERLKSRNSGEGKKPIRKQRNVFSIVAVVILVAFILGMAVWAAFQYGLPQRWRTAGTLRFKDDADVGVTAAEEKISVVDANILMGVVTRQTAPAGIFTPDGQKLLEQPSQTDPNKTMRDDLEQIVKESAADQYAMLAYAKANDIKVTDKMKEESQLILNQFKSDAVQQQLNFGTYLRRIFGPGVTEGKLLEFFNELQVGQQAKQHYFDNLKYEDDQIEKIYEDDPTAYDTVDYRMFRFTEGDATLVPPVDGKNVVDDKDVKDDKKNDGENKENPTDKDTDTDKKDEVTPQEKAKLFDNAVTDEESFRKLASECMAEDSRQGYDDRDGSLSVGVRKKSLNEKVAEWLYDDSRKAGDHTVIEDDKSATVVYFLTRQKPEENTYNVRHILITAADPNAQQQQAPGTIQRTDEEAKQEAERILKEWEDGDKTEDSFAALAEKYSEDPGSQRNGGLYEDVAKGTMVHEFEAFCLDEARQPGDTGIVKTQHGYHVMYFVGTGAPEYKVNVISDLRNNDFTEWNNKMTEAVAFEEGKAFGSIGED